MEFNIPKFQYGKRKIGVYRIWFNEYWFYIGSSKNLRSRFGCWKSKLHRRQLDKHLNIKQILPLINEVRFEILKEYKHPSYLRRKETEFLKKNWDNSLLLNRCPNGKNTNGMRPYNGYTPPPKILKGIPDWMRPKKVAVFTNDGILIKICNSIGEFERTFKIKHENVQKILDGKRGQPRKFKIKGVGKYGSFIEPKKFSPKKPTFILRYLPPSAPVYQYSMNGIFIKKFDSVKDAAIAVGCSRTIIFRVAGNKRDSRGRKSLSAKGYIWKYA